MGDDQVQVGDKFGLWTVVAHVSGRRYLCVCACGTEREQYASSLLLGKTFSCGCYRKGRTPDPGDVVGEWTVVSREPGARTALCRCSCGTEKPVDIYTLGKDSLSCGHERRTRVIGDSKECSNCGLLRPLSEFHKDASAPSGYKAWCMECVSDYHAEHSDTRNARMRELYRQDPQAKIAKTRQYHLDHPEWSKRVQREWHLENADRRYAEHLERGKDPEVAQKRREASMRCEQRRRAAKAGQDAAPITEEQYSDILYAYDDRCWICGVDLDAVPMHWDHYQPLSKGGTHTPENLRPSCSDCNTRKNSVWPITDERLDAIRRAVWARREAQAPDYKDSGLIPPTPGPGPTGEDAVSTPQGAAIAAKTGQP